MTRYADPAVPAAARRGAWRTVLAAAARPALTACALAAISTGLAGCAWLTPAAPGPGEGIERVSLPVNRGWFEGEVLFYITTEVSHQDVARDKKAHFTPRLAPALPAPGSVQRNPTDKVYAVTNAAQAPVFASAPFPMGPENQDAAYSPLWQMVKVSWRDPAKATLLRSEEEVLAAAEQGLLGLEPTAVVLNCTVVHRGIKGALPGAQISRARH